MTSSVAPGQRSTPNGGGTTGPGPDRARRTPFVAVVLALLAIGLVGQLLLNTSLQRGSFEFHDMQAASSDLADQQQVLEQELARRESPAALAARARLLGMVPSVSPVFLQLSDGSVDGTPTAAPTPTVPPTTPAVDPAATTPAETPAAGTPAAGTPAAGTPATEATEAAPTDPAATTTTDTPPPTAPGA